MADFENVVVYGSTTLPAVGGKQTRSKSLHERGSLWRTAVSVNSYLPWEGDESFVKTSRPRGSGPSLTPDKAAVKQACCELLQFAA